MTTLTTDPTRYHRDRINEALGFEREASAIEVLDAIADALRAQGQDESLIRSVMLVRGALLTVRDLCAEGDRT